MSTQSMTGNDSLVLNNHVFSDFGEGMIAELTFSSDLVNVKTGKNGNSLFALNATGNQGDLKIRLIRASADDKFLNQLLVSQNSNFEGTILIQGQFTKKVGDGQGNVTNDTYVLSNGVIQKLVEAKSNVEGDFEQSESIYMLKFSSVIRAIT